MARLRIALLATLIVLLSACTRQPPETIIHRWGQATWNNSHWH